MNRYKITRNIPGVGSLSPEDLRGAAAKSNEVLAQLGNDIAWDTSKVYPDHTVCTYHASGEDIIRQHAEISGFPADEIVKVGEDDDSLDVPGWVCEISPATANSAPAEAA